MTILSKKALAFILKILQICQKDPLARTQDPFKWSGPCTKFRPDVLLTKTIVDLFHSVYWLSQFSVNRVLFIPTFRPGAKDFSGSAIYNITQIITTS